MGLSTEAFPSKKIRMTFTSRFALQTATIDVGDIELHTKISGANVARAPF